MIHIGNTTPTIVGEDCSITHRVTLHGCTIGDRCLIGIGSTIMDGAVIAQGGSSVTNLGDISGAQLGITTISYLDHATGQFESRAIGTTVVNSGSISGEQDDGVRLIDGGSVVNSGTIRSGAGLSADGIQLQFIPGQDSGESEIGIVTNRAGATITGERYGIILAGGGAITNAGTISGGTNGVALVSQNFPAKVGTLINIGTINGGLLVHVDRARLKNVGTINNANGAGNLIEGGRADVINSGRISGNGVAIQFSAGDDQLILNTGSRIEGLSDGAAGFDRLVLEGSILELTADQAIGDVTGFESLAITVGYWNKTGSAGTFDSVVIGDGAALQINEAAVAGQAPVSSLRLPDFSYFNVSTLIIPKTHRRAQSVRCRDNQAFGANYAPADPIGL